MHWLLAIGGLVLGGMLSEGRPHGFAFGFVIGWLLGKQQGLRRDLEFLLQRIRTLEEKPAEPATEARVAPMQARAAVASVEPIAPVAEAAVPAAPQQRFDERGHPLDAEPPSAPEPAVAARAAEPQRAVFDLGLEPSAAPAAVPTAASESPAEPDSVASPAPAQPQSQPQPQPRPLPRPTMPPREPPGPPAFVRWFSSGNVPVKIGMVVLFFGVAALLKYAVDQGFFSFPIELRLAGIAAAAIGALVFAWRQRFERRAFALALEGGALGILMLTVFAAYRLYHLLPPGLAFGLLIVIVAGAALLAVLQDAVALAVLGFLGGYLAPVLISTGSANHVALFSYYAVLNAAVFGIAWSRPWRALNLIGFVFTFGVGLAWGARFYKPELFASVEPFLILFYFFYLAIPVLYAVRQPEERRGIVDGTLVFGAPLLAFPLQAALLRDDDMALAFSALALAVVYGALSWWVIRKEGLRVLGESFAGLAIGFATLSVPIALSARWTTCTWALEGAAMVWLGLRQSRQLPVYAGVLLQILAAGAYFYALVAHGGTGADDAAIVNGRFVSGALLAFAALFSSLRFERDGGWPAFGVLTFLAGWFWWAFTGVAEIDRFVPGTDKDHAILLFIAGSVGLAAFLRAPLAWPRLAWPVIVGLAIGLVASLSTWNAGPLRDLGAVAWPVFLTVGFLALRQLRHDPPNGVAVAHVAWLFTVAAVAGFELRHWALGPLGDTSAWTAVATFVPLIAMLWLSAVRESFFAAPLAEPYENYRQLWLLPAIMVVAVAWTLGLGHDGACAPLPFLPVLNPMDLAQIGVLLLFASLARRNADDAARSTLNAILLLAGFVLVSVMTLRGVHHLAQLPWGGSLLDSKLAQSSLTVVWSVIGVGAWIIGSKRGSRPVWTAGAVVMAVVLLKLLLVDRRFMGDMPGIVSFIAVGLLLTLVGYLAPSPPRDGAAEART